MLPVAGRPFVDWQIERLARAGFGEIIFCIGHLGAPIREHVGDGTRHGISVRYSDEGEALHGTGGAIRHALPMLSDAFLVTYGDSFLPFDYAAPLATLLAHEDCEGVMTVYENAGRWDASNVKTDGEWVLRYEKGSPDRALRFVDYGAIALRRRVFERLPARQAFGLDGLQTELAESRQLRAFIATERFYEIGSPAGLDDLERHLKEFA
jgi:NDP-sugar pyrophosphorylase family protein